MEYEEGARQFITKKIYISELSLYCITTIYLDNFIFCIVSLYVNKNFNKLFTYQKKYEKTW